MPWHEFLEWLDRMPRLRAHERLSTIRAMSTAQSFDEKHRKAQIDAELNEVYDGGE